MDFKKMSLWEKVFLGLDVVLFIYFLVVLFSSNHQDISVTKTRKSNLKREGVSLALKEAEKSLKEGNIDGYLSDLENIFKKNNSPQIAEKLINAYYTVGKLKEAEKYVDYLLNNNNFSKDDEFWKKAVKIKIERGKLKAAKDILENVKKRDVVYYADLGEIYFKAKKLSDALNFYWRAYQLDSKNINVLNNLGYINFLLGRYENAQDFYFKALKVDPRNLSVLKNLSIFYIKKAEFDKALIYLRKIVEFYPQSKDAQEAMFAIKKIGKELLKK